MKKTLLISGILLTSLIVNAASATWSAASASTVLPDGTTANGVVAYLFEGTLNQTVLDSIKTGTWNATASGYLATKKTGTSGLIFQTGIGSYENQTVSFSMLIFDATTYADAGYFKYAELNNVEFTTVNKTLTFSDALTNASWTNVVPEPTSGLLMLLGMAGLALRRKIA